MSFHQWPRFGRRLAAAAVLWGWIAAGAAAAEKAAAFRAALEAVSADDLQKHVDFLADDQREGREAGTRGGQAGGSYLAGQLAALHLRGAGSHGTYFQPFGPNFRNVLAFLEGSDPKLKSQVVIVGAHYDHVGYGLRGNTLGPAGAIHPGADDNASGTAGLLELARAFARLPQPPRRSILFAFWDAEEKGMLGSEHWIAHPTSPLDRVVLMVNLDMIGRLRNDRLVIIGSNSAYGLRRLLSSDNEAPPLSIDFRRTVMPQADHTPFHARNIPVLVFHTDMHAQYHRPSDTVAQINAPGMQHVVRLLFGAVYDVANCERPPQFREASHGERDQSRISVALPPDNGRPLRVGIVWRPDDAEPGTVVLTHVVPGSPAARAGLQPEDRVYQVNSRDFTDDAELSSLLKTLPGPITLLVERNGQLRTVEIQFAAGVQRRAA